MLERIAIHTQIVFDCHIPRLAQFRIGVPSIDQDTVDIEEDFHRPPVLLSRNLAQLKQMAPPRNHNGRLRSTLRAAIS
ncbi:hypothetical protein [Rhizobium cauense]|uniref:hypothetical protein n=1 Tax=Rhizobium cauense TaxID=1166683 RepID=UPI001C9E3630|nr:hypothetical protein [Rhizobium cauense]